MFDGPPALRVYPGSAEKATLTLRLGRGIRLGRDMTIEIYAEGDNALTIADGVEFHNNVRILLRSGAVSLGPRTRVRDGVLLKSDGDLVVGEAVTLGPYGAVHCSERIVLEDFVGLGERVSLVDSDHAFDGEDLDFLKKPLTTSPILIARQTMIAIGSVVLRGAEIGANSVVAANSVVREGSYAPGSMIAGNPARAVKSLGQD
jgi:acetyltransferase-like isoleucine patch superfamily enzyme